MPKICAGLYKKRKEKKKIETGEKEEEEIFV